MAPFVDEPLETVTRHLRARGALRPPSTKTGTLTCNVMDYRKCSINGVSYGLGSTEIGKAYARRTGRPIEPEPVAPAGAVRTPHVNFLDPAYDAHVAAGGAQLAAIADFNLHLALNHEASVRRRRRVEEDGLLLFRALVLGFVLPLLSRSRARPAVVGCFGRGLTTGQAART